MQGPWICGAVSLLCLCLPAVVAAQTQTAWRPVGQVGGPTQAVAVQGQYAYAGIGLRMVVLNISEPAEPREVGATRPFPYFVQDIAVSGSFAYVAAGAGGLRVIDISNPASPTEIGAWESRGFAEGVAVAGNTVYLANGPYGLRVLDVSKPSQPVELGSAYVLNYAFKVAVVGSRAYLAAAGAGLLIVNASDPKRPVEVGSLDTTGYSYGVAVAGNTAYIADGWEGVKIVDVADPARPRQIGAWQTPGWALSVVVLAQRAYVADAFRGLRVLDVSDPRLPAEIASAELPDGHAASVALAGEIAYVADRNRGLRAVSLTPDAASATLPEVSLYSPLGYAHAVAVSGNYAYVAAYTFGLRVIDISDPAHPWEVGAYDTESLAWSVVVEGDYAYVATSNPPFKGRGLHIVDIRDPANPVQAGWVRNPGGAYRDLAVSGGIAHLPNEWGLQTVDVSDPRTPKNLAFLDMRESPPVNAATGVDAIGTVTYVAAAGLGLKIVDATDASAPVIIGNYRTPGVLAEDVVVADGRAYVVGMGGIALVDVSDPRRPLRIGEYAATIRGERMALAGNSVFVAQGSAGVAVLDASSPAKPVLAATYDTMGYAQDLAVRGDYVYVADGVGGLLILRKGQTPAGSGSGSPAIPAVRSRPAPRTTLRTPAQPSRPARERTAAEPVPRPVSGATCVVTSTADNGGPGSLRQCLQNAVNGDTVAFDPAVFPPGDPAVIALSRSLGIDRGGVTLDASNAGVVLDGHALPPGGNCLSLNSDANAVRGLRIAACPAQGIGVRGARNTIGGDRMRGSGPTGEGNLITGCGFRGVMFWGPGSRDNILTGNLIGTDAKGTAGLGNRPYGVAVQNGAQGNRIGGATPGERNIISGNVQGGVYLAEADTTDNIVAGNYIGLDPSGAVAIGNGGHGVVIERARRNRVGGTADGERNVIGGNALFGVSLSDNASGNVVAGNYIGVNAAGNAALPNLDTGIGIETKAYHNAVANNVIVGGARFGVVVNDWNSSYNAITGNLIGTDATGTRAFPSGMGGVWIGMGAGFNRIGGSTPAERNVIAGGIQFPREAQMGNLVIGNFIGTDITGTIALGARSRGVDLSDTSRPFIGGTTPGERNIISGNLRGVEAHPGADYAFIGGNYIGTDVTGASALGNQTDGIGFFAGAHNLVQGNRIAHNLGNGVSAGASNTIRANAIYGNSGQGIAAAGSENGGAPAPAIATVTATTVSGSACAGCEVEIYSDSDGQGRYFEGSVIAAASGAFAFTKATPLTGPNVTATATDRGGSTSRFSAAKAVPR
ncbi:MAG: right-handed parallel beta-helix repeat-containing protein [Bryobacterales bacterium]|nr:right-handed parallel beta-helix repeat-containing protein [Bryobacterales bacterium]